MNKLITGLAKQTNKTTTENGADTLLSSMNPLVDFFALAGATRGNEELGLDLFLKAFAFDREKAIRVLFYLRDIRGGQGERQLFKNCLSYLAEHEPKIAEKLIHYIPEYGRWDDMFALPVKMVLPAIKRQLAEDFTSATPSLLAKWMPSENTSSKKTCALAKEIREALGDHPSSYRKGLSKIRAKIKLVEQQMSKGEFDSIEYGKVPSQASLKYRKAFKRNDETRYTQYLESVTKGDDKINASTLYPYQVYEAVHGHDSVATDQLWNALPDYTTGKNAIVVADVSGSMSGRPMSVSVSLALYFAERNKGQFKDHFITFTTQPRLQEIKGKTLHDKMNSIETADWDGSTNLIGVFNLILHTAIENNCSEDEMPSTIYIISDMEFDSCVKGKTNFETIREAYENQGYKLPHLVFWNVDARNKQVPVEHDENGTSLVSGLSPSIFKIAVEGKTPIELVEDIINSERYVNITI